MERLPLPIRRRIVFNREKKYRPDELLRIIQSIESSDEWFSEELEYLKKCNEKISDSIKEITDWIINNLQYQIIYYPTYRRFEDYFMMPERKKGD